MEFIDFETRERVKNRGISDSELTYCLENSTNSYTNRLDTVFCVELPDGRYLKVAVRTNTKNLIANAIALI